MTRPSGLVAAAVISTYRPDQRVIGLVEVLLPDCAAVVVVDDGSGAGAWDPIFAAVERAGAHVLRRPRNEGIAAALNAGIALVIDESDAVVTFDQDSSPPEGYVRILTGALAATKGSSSGEIAALVPEFFTEVRQARGGDVAPDLAHARKVIQSGMLIPAHAVRALGGMREDLFIDLVDTELELRALARGWQVMAVRGTALPHALGHRVRLRILPGIRIVTSVSTPFRFYYRARNRVVVARAYARRFPARVLRETAVDAAFFMLAVLGARPRRALLNVIARGVRDGMRGSMGRVPESVERRARGVRWADDAIAGE